MVKHIICILFGHKFGEWEYVADNSCEQKRVCKRDGYTERREVPHEFGEWEYVADNSCEQKRVCKRDGYTQSWRRAHEFGEWEYVADNSCEQKRVCKRDGYIDTQRAPHDWEEVDRKPDIIEEGPFQLPSRYDEGDLTAYYAGIRQVEVTLIHYKCRRCGKEKWEIER